MIQELLNDVLNSNGEEKFSSIMFPVKCYLYILLFILVLIVILNFLTLVSINSLKVI